MANLASIFTDLLDPSKYGRMTSDELLQQMAWLYDESNGTPESKEALKTILGLRTGIALYNTLTNQQRIDAYRAEAIQAITAFCVKNPRASNAEIGKEVEKHLGIFAARVAAE